MPVPLERFPEIQGCIVTDLCQVDDMAVFLCPIPDDGIFTCAAGEVDPQEQASVCPEVFVRERLRGRRVAEEQRIGVVQFFEGGIRHRRVSTYEPDLIQAIAGAHLNSE